MSSKIRFAHLADLHLGAFREKRLTDLNFKTFKLAIEKIIEENVDFCLFSGDIFNNAMPPIDLVEKVTIELMKLKVANIPLYVIGGSHDYSNTGKSFLTLLEAAGVFIDVNKFDYVDKDKINLKFTKDNKNPVVIAGVLGKKNGLDKNIYLNLEENSSLLSENNFNIFMFHTTLGDFKPDFMKNVDCKINSSFLPKGFDYYAGGHVHTYIEGSYCGGKLSYPGPLFPNNFSELKRETPSFNLCEFDFSSRSTKIKRIFLKTYDMIHVEIDIDNKNPVDAKYDIEKEVNKVLDIENKLVLLEIFGIVDGKVSDIKILDIVNKIYEKGAFHVLKNTYKLTSSQLKIDTIDYEDEEDIEKIIIEDNIEEGNNRIMEIDIINSLLKLDLSKQESEKVAQYEQRIITSLSKTLNTLKY